MEEYEDARMILPVNGWENQNAVETYQTIIVPFHLVSGEVNFNLWEFRNSVSWDFVALMTL
jgi:hypothetical protein